LHSILRQSTIRRLRVSGQRIETKVVSVELNRSVEINAVHPYRIVSQWTKGNEVYVFRSENIWFDPSDYIRNDKITVIVDPGNIKKILCGYIISTLSIVVTTFRTPGMHAIPSGSLVNNQTQSCAPAHF